MDPDDVSLVEAHKAGDAEAFAQLYDRYARRIFDFVYYKTHHRETAEDIVSQTFLKALEGLGQYQSAKGAFSAWLHRIARNLVIDHYRAKRPTSPIEDAWDLSGSDDVVRDADAALKIETVREYLGTLKPDQRDILLLRLWSGYSFAEIAEVLGKSEGACKVAYHRAIGAMRAELLTFFFLFLLS